MKKGKNSKKKTTIPKKKKSSTKKTFSKNKRLLIASISVFLFLVIALSFISVDNRNITGHQTDETNGDLFEGIKAVADRIVEMVTPFFSKILGGEMTGGLLFTKILFFAIVFGIILLSLKRVEFFSTNPVILNIITIAVSLLAVRGLSIELIETILRPSQALGIALLAGIPFVIYFIIINVGFKTQQPIFRRIAWIFFAVIFIGLGLSSGEEVKASSLHYIYLVTALGAILMAGIDGTIKRFFEKIEVDKNKEIKKIEDIGNLEIRRARAEENTTIPSAKKEKLLKHLDEEIRRVKKR